jgi:hypothetical protein
MREFMLATDLHGFTRIKKSTRKYPCISVA